MAHAGPSRSPWVERIALLLLAAALALPSLFKPPHIDEESYLFIAREVASHPELPYHWWRAWQPFGEPAPTSFIYAHPPFFFWVLAGLGSALGWDQVMGLRLVMGGFGGALVLAIHAVARRLTAAPLWASAAILAAPGVLLVLHQSLMIDLPTLALGVAAVALSFGRGRGRAAAAGLLWGLACLTKYPMLLLAPVLWMAGAPRPRGERGAVLGIGLGMVLAFEGYCWGVYGAPHLPYVLSTAPQIARSPLASRAAGVLAHLGSTTVAPGLALLLFAWRPRPWLRLGVSLGGAALLVGALDGAARTGAGGAALVAAAEGVPPSVGGRLLLVGAFTLGLQVLGVLGEALVKRGGRSEDRLLAGWALLFIGGVLFGHNFVGARYLALASVPAGLLVWRLGERSWGLGGMVTRGALLVGVSAALAVAVGWADLRWATGYPVLVARAQGVVASAQRRAKAPGEVWYAGEWAFRWEAERRGWRPVGAGTPAAGDLLVVAREAAPELAKIPADKELLATIDGPAPRLRTHDGVARIGFYSEVFGLLPYGLGEGPVEVVEIWQVRSPAETAPLPEVLRLPWRD